MIDDLVARALAWADDDPDPVTRDQVISLAEASRAGDAAAESRLRSAFDGTLTFGTAGIRGAMGGGPSRMNRAVVMRAAAGLAEHVRALGGQSVVIGFDARHRSDEFAHDAAAVIDGAGLTALVLPRALPTPVLAYAVLHLGVDAGVMVTASHNPAGDNGFKVYLGSGVQITPPHDAQIASRIAAIATVKGLPLGDDWTTLDDSVLNDYLATAAAVVCEAAPRSLTTVYTPMHGVGGRPFLAVMEAAGFSPPVVVAEQFEPHAEFPTVPFPNPEEPGAMDLALAAATRVDADVVIAHDPDADRCAVGVRWGNGHRLLTGDEVGLLLGWWAVERGRRGWAPAPTGCFATSIVSSSLLGAIATDAGLRHQVTLTGFKWIASIDDLEYGYEEALGYCVDPAHVRDKDGITAGLRVLELIATLKAEGRGAHDVLDEITRRHGVHLTGLLSLRFDHTAEVTPLMARLRDSPPTRLGEFIVESAVDLEHGYLDLPPTAGFRYSLGEAGRVVVRPSGTEPLLKCYVEVVLPARDDIAVTRAEAERQLAAIGATLTELLELLELLDGSGRVTMR